jgi:hypothetical protein
MAGARLRIPAYVCLASIVFGTGASLRAQQCRAEAVSERLATGGQRGADGKVYYTIRFESTVKPGVRNAVQGAARLWNGVSKTTNAMLVVVPDTTIDADVTIRGAKDFLDHRGCASFKTGTSIIYYSIDDYADWVDSDQEPRGAAVIMAHELGHFLGLEEANPAVNSIVAQHDGSCRSYAASPRVREPTPSDAKVVGECIKRHRPPAGKK